MANRPTVVKGGKDGETAESSAPFDTQTLDFRGQHFVVRELSSKEYDKCVALATDGKTGELDTVKLLRWMMIEAVVEPEGFDADALGALSFTTTRQLSKVVNDIHFPPVEGEDPNA